MASSIVPARCGQCALHDWLQGGHGRADLVAWAVRTGAGRVALVEAYRQRADKQEPLRWRIPASRQRCRHGHALAFDADEAARQLDRGDDVVYIRAD